MNNDLVSIIVPVYNTEKYIRECLDALANQTYQNLEVILIDDGSTDSSSLICNEYCKEDERFNVFHRSNHGISSSRNYGLKEAHGKYIMFCDSDDKYNLNMVETMVSSIKKYNTNIARCTFNSQTHKEDISDISYKVLNTKSSEVLYRFLGKKNEMPCFVSVLIFDRDYMVSAHDDITYMEDTYFMINLLLKANTIVFINEKLYNYRFNPTSITRTSNKALSNINSGLLCYSVLENILNNNEMLFNDLRTSMNTKMTYLIYNKLNLISKSFYLDNKDQIINSIQSKEFKDTLKLCNKKEIPLQIRFVRYLLLKNRYDLMFKFLSLKNSIKYLIKR